MLSSHSHTSSSSIHLASQVFVVVVVLCSGLLHCGAVSYVKCIGLYRFGVFCLHRFLSVVVVLVVVWYIVRFLNWTTKFARGKHMSVYILLLLLWGIVDHLLFGQGQVGLGSGVPSSGPWHRLRFILIIMPHSFYCRYIL